MDYKLLSILYLTISSFAFSQTSIDEALNSIAQNNKHIQSSKQYVVTKQLENRSGIYPDNPFISGDYMIGRPVAGGNQFDFSAVQSLEFPTVYFKKGQLANKQNELLEIEIVDLRQTILLEAKLLMIELIYLNRQKATTEERIVKARLIVDDYQKKYDVGQISGLPLNKSKIQLLNIRSVLRNLSSKIKIKTEHLSELNGGIIIDFKEMTYPLTVEIPEFEMLEDTIEYYDPLLKILNHQARISESQLALSKAMTLPKFEAGYRYQSVLGQTFNGFHFGLSIPLWERKNSVKTEKARADLTAIEIKEHETEHYYEIKELYTTYENLKEDIKEYEAVLGEMNSEEILQKSLDLEEINFITYAMELNYYYSAHDHYNSIQKEYHSVIAKLYKHQL